MKWSPAFASGFEMIDGHHKQLFRMAQDDREALDGFRQRYEADGSDAEESRRLVDTLDQWLSSHICRLDVQLRQVAP